MFWHDVFYLYIVQEKLKTFSMEGTKLLYY